MPRKSTKGTEVTMTAIDEAINTPVNFQFGEVAEALGIGEVELRERLEDKMGNSEVHQLDTIPVEWEPAIKAIKIDLETEASVRRLNAVTEPPIPQPQVQEEPPILQEEPQSQRRRGRPKKESSALTQQKSQTLKESDQKAQQLAVSDQQVKVALHARKGQKSGAQLATVELAAEDLTYRKIKAEALTRKVGQLTSEIAAESNFDPIQVLKELGIDSNSEIFEGLREQIEPALGKLESATAEIVDNAWVNGIDLEAELGNLESLMNSNEFTSDYWQ
jgi:hypothetical protein